MRLRIHPAAREEARAAVEWYERRQAGLGSTFSTELLRALDIIADAPEAWPTSPGVKHPLPIRRFLLPGFPFALPYVVLEDEVVLLAIAHLRRQPGYWLARAQRLSGR
jgi:plasmid stabilization system protein ParE